MENEIKETKSIDSIIGVKVLSNATEQITIRIRKNNVKDLRMMREPKNWPKTVFGSKIGLNVKTISNELPLFISGLDKNKSFDSKMIDDLMRQEKISYVKRQWFTGAELPVATNKVNFTANNLKSYVDNQKKGFFFVDGVKGRASN